MNNSRARDIKTGGLEVGSEPGATEATFPTSSSCCII
jgi:hypothetical protein